MMKLYMTVIFCLFSFSALAAECLGVAEKNRVREKIEEINPDYVNYFYDGKPVDNIIDCSQKKSQLSQYVCARNDLLLMFRLQTRIDAHQQANILKREPSLSDIKKLNKWEERYEKKSNFKALCYELKDATMSIGGGKDPYYSLYGKSQFFYYMNSHGFVLQDQNGHVIYLGKSCDSLSTKYGKGTWGRAKGGFIISFRHLSISFPKQELSIKSLRCKP